MEMQIMPEAAHEAPRCVFVYGTLRRGGHNDINRLRPAPVLLGRAWVGGLLYDLGAYPGLRLGAASTPVWGEVYRIDPRLEPELDAIEEIGPSPDDEYFRREWVVQLDGQAQRCLVYEINPRRLCGCTVIAHGDWLRHLEEARGV